MSDTAVPNANLLLVVYGEDRIVLHPHMNIVEFREARRQVDVMLLRLATQRARNAVQS